MAIIVYYCQKDVDMDLAIMVVSGTLAVVFLLFVLSVLYQDMVVNPRNRKKSEEKSKLDRASYHQRMANYENENKINKDKELEELRSQPRWLIQFTDTDRLLNKTDVFDPIILDHNCSVQTSKELAEQHLAYMLTQGYLVDKIGVYYPTHNVLNATVVEEKKDKK